MKEINDIIRYYSNRAYDYDRSAGYFDREAEKIRTPMKQRHQAFAQNQNILEIACGTGYWTRVIAETARSVLALDASRTMISIAKEKCKHLKHVTFLIGDAYTLENIPGTYSAAYAHWWWSHMPRKKIPGFLHVLHSKLQPGARVLFSDHLPDYREEHIDVIINSDGDRVEKRTLPNNKTYFVIKNFPTQIELHTYLDELAENIDFKGYDGFWELQYTRI